MIGNCLLLAIIPIALLCIAMAFKREGQVLCSIFHINIGMLVLLQTIRVGYFAVLEVRTCT
jgi:hypothetical protein